jgi:hypothetical protein
LSVSIAVLLADRHTFRNDKGVYVKRMLGVEVP